MHNVHLETLQRTAAAAVEDSATARMQVELAGEWQVAGGPQFRGRVPFPGGEIELTADFPPPLGGEGRAPSPLAYCFWGGIACYAMTYATEAAREGIELRGLRARVLAAVDLSRSLGVSDAPPVEKLTWELDVDADAPTETLARLKDLADERCPGYYCLTNPIAVETRLA